MKNKSVDKSVDIFEISESFFNKLGIYFWIGFIALILLFTIGIWAGIDYCFLEDIHKTKSLVKPDIIIQSKTVNGIKTSDTTYVYHFK